MAIGVRFYLVSDGIEVAKGTKATKGRAAGARNVRSVVAHGALGYIARRPSLRGQKRLEAFAKIRAARDMRRIQLGARFSF